MPFKLRMRIFGEMYFDYFKSNRVFLNLKNDVYLFKHNIFYDI